MITKIKQKGVYAVEFAIVGSLFFMLFFAVMIFFHVMFTWDVLTEVSRRGARLATVCQVSQNVGGPLFASDAVLNAAIDYDPISKESRMLRPLTKENLQISYLDYAGNTATTFTQIRLVHAKIVGYSYQLSIPFVDIPFLNSPSFSTTLPRESFGVTRYGYTTCD
ncbi:hypothetical protein CXF72_10020 [Psychromonas sp. MB-3u-54]|uniref:TadE/TadG family type IV pilus assembly protein n=1 Tax=Psychromonas sp. MB-3u-54 TaxID=2058319 RepID=UPI000C32AD83|nr:TadE/TadG family type IV pilus assembly protein [Psychromonas sp. MB-3u-54]PKH02741.1 hypothetical protein CXF72_10020 [Psychromonas sp. MB-3u-54]